MMGYPPPAFVLLQGLITALLLLAWPLGMAFGGRLRIRVLDVLLALLTPPTLALVTIIVFLPFEGDWADRAFGPLAAFHALLVGGAAVMLGMAVTQWKALARRGTTSLVYRLCAAFLIGAFWGVVWVFAGWVLQMLGMSSNG